MPSCKYLKSKGYIYGPPIDGNGKVLQSSCKKNVCLCMRGDKDPHLFFFFDFARLSCLVKELKSFRRTVVELSGTVSWTTTYSPFDQFIMYAIIQPQSELKLDVLSLYLILIGISRSCWLFCCCVSKLRIFFSSSLSLGLWKNGLRVMVEGTKDCWLNGLVSG